MSILTHKQTPKAQTTFCLAQTIDKMTKYHKMVEYRVWFDPPKKSYLAKDYAIEIITHARVQWGSMAIGPAQIKDIL